MRSSRQAARSAIALCGLLVAACAGVAPAPESEPAPPIESVATAAPELPTDAPLVAPSAVAGPTDSALQAATQPEPAVAPPGPPPSAPPASASAARPTPATQPAPRPAAATATPPPATVPSPTAAAASEAPAPAPPAATAPTVAAVPAAAPLDFSGLETRLRQTKAIGVLTKISVKNEATDLLEAFRAYHSRQNTSPTLTELRRGYDMLLLKLLALLQDGDPPLAKDIDRSRAAIWEVLSDPQKFVASNLMAGA